MINISVNQNLEPRLMSMAPTGLNFAIGSYAYSKGNIITDVSFPVEDLDADIHSAVVGYHRTFIFLDGFPNLMWADLTVLVIGKLFWKKEIRLQAVLASEIRSCDGLSS